ncbi:MAG: glycine betaine ABC transporter substrate-binding protein [Chloroflexota bacterium]
MRLNRTLALGASLLVLLGACTTGGGGASPAASTAASAAPAASTAASTAPSSAASVGALPTVRIGSDDFYESTVVAEMWAQVLEKAGYKVDRHYAIGARPVRVKAMESGQIDLVPEYVGSGLGFYDKTQTTSDGQQNHDKLQAIVTTKGGGLTVFNISPGEDTNAFVVRGDTATQDNLSKISDLTAKQDTYKWGLPADCDSNPLCGGALKDGYGFKYPPKTRKALGPCSSTMAQALQGKAIDIAELCSTQPAIAQFGFKLLEDDKKTQPAENMAAMVRNDLLAKVGDKAAFQKLLDDVTAKLTTEELTKLGVEIDVNHKDAKVVATDFLKAQGLLS